jgi:hypothetical protein
MIIHLFGLTAEAFYGTSVFDVLGDNMDPVFPHITPSDGFETHPTPGRQSGGAFWDHQCRRGLACLGRWGLQCVDNRHKYERGLHTSFILGL